MKTVPLSSLNIEDVLPHETETDILNASITKLKSFDDNYSVVETDPSYNTLAVTSYREFIKTQEFNDLVKSLFLGHAKGAKLDFIGNTYHLTPRLILDEGDATATPPIDPVYESDEDYTARILLSGYAYNTAGSKKAYIYHVMTASGDIKDTSIVSPSAVTVDVVVLSRIGDGLPDAALVTLVDNHLDDDKRPFTDQVIVQAATILNYLVDVSLILYPGFDSETIRSQAEAALLIWIDEQHSLGRDITIIGIGAALKVAGVHNVVLNDTGGAITADLVVSDYEAAFCTGVAVAFGGYGE